MHYGTAMQQRLSTAATPQHAKQLSNAAMFSHAEMLFGFRAGAHLPEVCGHGAKPG